MHPVWENAVILTVVAAAACFLAIRAWRLLFSNRSTGCGTCPRNASGADERTVVSVESLTASAGKPHGADGRQ